MNCCSAGFGKKKTVVWLFDPEISSQKFTLLNLKRKFVEYFKHVRDCISDYSSLVFE